MGIQNGQISYFFHKVSQIGKKNERNNNNEIKQSVLHNWGMLRLKINYAGYDKNGINKILMTIKIADSQIL